MQMLVHCAKKDGRESMYLENPTYHYGSLSKDQITMICHPIIHSNIVVQRSLIPFPSPKSSVALFIFFLYQPSSLNKHVEFTVIRNKLDSKLEV
jgi:hypothetical protein